MSPHVHVGLSESRLWYRASSLGVSFGLAILLVFPVLAEADNECLVTSRLTPEKTFKFGEFGRSVSISGNWAAVGTSSLADAGCDTGEVWLFQHSGVEWVLQGSLSSPTSVDCDGFGFAVALEGDFLFIGAPLDAAWGVESGAVHVYRFDGSAWPYCEKLLAGDGSPNDEFGGALAAYEDLLLVGTSCDSGCDNPGLAYVFRNVEGSWVEEQKMTASDGQVHDHFGNAVALTDNTALIGAPDHEVAGVQTGAAYIFRETANGWLEKAKLTADDGEEYDAFGASVAIDGSSALVGAFARDVPVNGSGGVYVYHFENGAWTFEVTLTSPDPHIYDYFGKAIAIEEDRVLVGADRDTLLYDEQGVIYSYLLENGQWMLDETMVADDAEEEDFFGGVIAMDDGYAVIGATGKDGSPPIDAGAAYVFKSAPADCNENDIHDTCEWNAGIIADCQPNEVPDECDIGSGASTDYNHNTIPDDCEFPCPEETVLISEDESSGDDFGYAVAIEGEFAFVGALDASSETGAVFVYRHTSLGWEWWQTLSPEVLRENDWFGSDIAVDGDWLMSAAFYHDAYQKGATGGVFAFQRQDANWNYTQRLLPDDAQQDHNFGASIALLGDRALIGAIGDDDIAFDAGAAYLFQRQGSEWHEAQKFTVSGLESQSSFGYAVAMTSHRLAIGAPSDGNPSGVDAGAIFVFGQRGDDWVLESELHPPKANVPYVGLGHSLVLLDEWLLAGVIEGEYQGQHNPGAVFIYRLGDDGWKLQQRVHARDPKPDDGFGSRIALDGLSVLVGAYKYNEGSASIFRLDGEVWKFRREIRSQAVLEPTYFGYSLDLQGDTAIIGAWLTVVDSSVDGSAHIIVGINEDCNGNGEADACDIYRRTSTDHNTNGVPDECEA